MIRTIFLLSLIISAAAFPAVELKRLGLFVGMNDGGKGRVLLRYAEEDAAVLARVFTDIGGMQQSDVLLITNATRSRLIAGIDSARERIAAAKRTSVRTEFIFYYSGHSDEEGLKLKGETYGYRELKETVGDLPSDMHIVILDSCSSGALTRLKGGSKRPAFLFDTAANAQGYAFLTSSSMDESSQESDAIGGSFFTHALVSGLRGAADATRDRKVTLNEAYHFAYQETLARTERTEGGAQHPSYAMRIAGAGDVVMTDISKDTASLTLDATLGGRISVRDANGRLIVELNKVEGQSTDLGLEPGAYRVILSSGKDIYETTLRIDANARAAVTLAAMRPVNAEAVVKRGDTTNTAVTNVLSVNLPVNLSLVPSRWMMPQQNYRTVDTVSLGLIGADADMLAGAAFSAGANIYYRGADGAIFSGVASIVHGALRGAAMSGVFTVTGDVTGVAASGVFNTTAGRMNGATLAGIYTITGDITGAAGAGIFTVAGDVRGIQAAGIFNTAGTVNGAQLAGIFNTAGNVSGMQAGLINIAGNVSGVQIGLVNIADDASFSIGLVNVIKNGMCKPFIFEDDMLFTTVGVRSGTRAFHTLVLAGVRPDLDTVTLRVGVGSEMRFDPFFLAFDVNAGEVHSIRNVASLVGRYFTLIDPNTPVVPSASTNTITSSFIYGANFVAQVRVTFGLQIFDHLGVFAGVSYNYCHRYSSTSIPLGRLLPYQFPYGDGNNIHWPGFFVGMQF